MESPHIVIVGAGIVGCQIFRKLILSGHNCTILEKDAEVMNGASAGNSGIFHCAFDANPSFTEYQLMRDSWSEIDPLLNPYFPLQKTGAHLVAWNDQELVSLQEIIKTSHQMGFKEIKWVPLEEFKSKEPNININLVKGVLSVPNEFGIDSWRFGLLALFHALKNNGKLIRNCKVLSGKFDKDSQMWKLSVKTKEDITEIKANIIINCAGNFGDLLEESLTKTKPDYKIRPRKGEFVVYKNKFKNNQKLVNSFIYPIPNEITKGILLIPTIYGLLAVGPTAEDQDEREFPTNNMNVVNSLIKLGVEMTPSLEKSKNDYIGYYAGLRPSAVDIKDYIFRAEKDKNLITLAGIRSTGVTGSLGIARKVLEICNSFTGKVMVSQDKNNQDIYNEWEQICKDVDIQISNLRKNWRDKTIVDDSQLLISFMGEKFKVTHPLAKLGIKYGEEGSITYAKPKF
jgi:glycerol-3-phosphate dehydrogenase